MNINNNMNNLLNNASAVNNLLNNANVEYNNQALILYSNTIADIKSNEMSDSKESFPWLFDREGKQINYTDNVNIFQAIELISNYLEKKFNENPENISKVKISELIEVFDLDNKKVRVLDLYINVSNLYNKDKEFFSRQEEVLNENSIVDNSSELKPLGVYGDITLNKICNNLKDLKWEGIIANSKITFNVVPFCSTLIGYGIIMRSYVRLVYKAPLLGNDIERKMELVRRDRNLALFGVLGAPLTLCLIKLVSPSIKDLITISLPIENKLELENNNKIINSLIPGFTVFTYLNNKIPNWLKLFFKLILLSVLVLKLLGINIIEFMSSLYYIRLYCYVVCTMIIFYQLLNLFLLHIFSKKKVKIPKVLPEFLINWLQEFELSSSSVESIKQFKTTCYKEIFIYLSILVIITLFF